MDFFSLKDWQNPQVFFLSPIAFVYYCATHFAEQAAMMGQWY
jgi:hypothetical protein